MSPSAVTVVLPTRDRFELLLRTVACVLRQKRVDVQLVVVDDGSRDNTHRRLAGLDPRITVLRNETSQGVSRARNRGLTAVDSPWVAFLDDDDLWAPDKLSRQLAALQGAPGRRWACSAAATFFEHGSIGHVSAPPAEGNVAVTLLQGNVIPGGGSGVLSATELVREVGGFDPRLANLADWDCWLRLAQASPLATVNSCDVGYRSHPTSMAHGVRRSEQELAVLRRTHDALYRAADVEVDQHAWAWYLQSLTYSGGSWAAGARRSAGLILKHGGGFAALKQPVKNVHRPTMQRRADRVARRRFPVEYRFARAWLDEELHGRQACP